MNSVTKIRSLGRMARSPASDGWYSYSAEAVARDAEVAYAGGGRAGEGVGWKKPCFSFSDALLSCWVGGGDDGV